MKNKFSLLSASFLLVTGITLASIAAPAYALRGGNPGNPGNPGNSGGGQTSSAVCSLTDISLGDVNATACDGPNAGNDTGDKGTLLDELNGGLFSSFIGTGVQWSLAGKSDSNDVPNPFGFKADNNLNDGKWSLSTPLSSNTFVVSLKAGNDYTAYLFKDYDFSQGLTGVFNTIGVSLDGSENVGKALSHASLFVSDIRGTQPPVTPVPEPASLLGLGLVAGGMVIVRRRRTV